MDHGILTTRFNEDTYMETMRWRETHNYNGCIYNLKTRISHTNLYDRPYFVLEMNNSTNEVMGIGVIENKVSSVIEHVYENRYLNRYTYKGAIRVPLIKENLTDEDKSFYDTHIKNILFYGKGHMKRGQSMTHFPKHKMKPSHISFLKKIVYQE